MSTSFRFPGLKNKENTERGIKRDVQTPTYAATLNLATREPNAYTAFVIALTGAATINIAVGTSTTHPMVDDRIVMFLTSDGTSRTVTFGTGVLPTVSTFAITTAKYAFAEFVFNGTGWLEVSRSISA